MSRRERFARVLPFAFATFLAVGLTWLPEDGPRHPAQLALAAALALAVLVAVVVVPWSRLPAAAQLAPVAGYCVAVELLRASTGSGIGAGYTPLLLLPVIWEALYGRVWVLYATVATVIAANLAALAMLPSGVTSASQWRSVILSSVVAVVVAETIRRLVADRAALLAQTSDLARRDQLTGLANRRAWDERYPTEVAASHRTGEPLTVAMIDLDRFKAYNDRHGHGAGDQLLQDVAQLWQSHLRPHDLLVRWGGEEFALLLPGTDGDDALHALHRLQAAMPRGQTFSAGCCTHAFGAEGPSPDAVVEAADRALYEAKQRGRAQVVAADGRAAARPGPERPEADARKPDTRKPDTRKPDTREPDAREPDGGAMQPS